MTIALRGTAQSGIGANGADVTLTFDVAPQEGDVAIVFGGHGVAATTLSAPGVDYEQVDIHTGVAPIWGAWYKFMGATPDSDVVCSGGGDILDSAAYCSYVFSGVDAAVLDQITETIGPLVGTTVDCPAITTQTDLAVVLALAGKDVTDAAISGPSGYSAPIIASGSDTNDISTAGAFIEVATAGAEDPSFFGTWNSGNYYGITMALLPDQGSPPEPPAVGGVTFSHILLQSGDSVLLQSGDFLLRQGPRTASRKPGVQDTDGDRNKRESRFSYVGANDVSYRLGDGDVPNTNTADNKNRNRYS